MPGYAQQYLHSDLDEILKILGSTTTTLLLFNHDRAQSDVGAIQTDTITWAARDEAAVRAVDLEFAPVELPCGLFAYTFHSGLNQHIAASADSANHSFGNGTVDSAFSVGAWIMPFVLSDKALIAKYGSTANLEEWKWQLLVTTGALTLELHDASASASEISSADGFGKVGQDGIPDLMRWSFVCSTYDGTQTAPTIRHYINAVDVSNENADSTETGSYVAMENTATPLLVGASDVSGTAAEEYDGMMALPFIAGKELSGDEVSSLYQITRRMVLGRPER